jgi:hypothetical protein
MIERATDSGTGGGISAENVAVNFVLPEVDRVAIRVSSIKTPRDDLFEPGQTHQINSSYLGLDNELLWCMSVTRECDDRWFVQTMEYIGGGSTAAVAGELAPFRSSTLRTNQATYPWGRMPLVRPNQTRMPTDAIRRSMLP